MRNLKKLSLMVRLILCIIVTVVFILHFFTYKVIADPIGLRIQKVTVGEQYVIISGFNYGGLYNYRSYTTKYLDGVLCIKYSGGFDMPWLEGRNSPDFCPVFYKYKDLSKIYLSSAWNDKRRLIWTKVNGEILT